MICPLCGRSTPEKPRVYQQGRTTLYLCPMCYAEKQLLNQQNIETPKLNFWSILWLKIKNLFKKS